MQPGKPDDEFDLNRFVAAQRPEYDDVRGELAEGRKYGHWMWFIFPQIQGLGRSGFSVTYAISSLREARAYLAHPILGTRLRECTRLVNQVDGRSAQDIFGHVDSMKFRSCMTLFARAAPDEGLFAAALEKYFKGRADPLTLEILATARDTD
jgi:uncharacterized protein (DUF1810 family)